MNEKHAKKLVQQSLVRTSEDFTDELMHKIELQKRTAPVKVKWWPPLVACLAVALLGILLSKLFGDNSFFTASQKRLFQALLSLFLIFSFYGFYSLKKKVDLLR